MDQKVQSLLQATLVPDTTTVSNAEQALKSLHSEPEYPFALLNLATHNEVNSGLRQSALTNLRQYVEASWSPQFETFLGAIYLNEDAKAQLRGRVLAMCTSVTDGTNDGSLQRLASQIVAKIASVDFPENWPSLFQEMMETLKMATHDGQAQGAMRVLLEMVDSGLSEEQFFVVAPDVVNALQHITQSQLGSLVKASSLNVLRSCFESLEQVLESENGPAARAFLEESLKQWMPLFMHIMRQPLPEVTQADFDKGTINITNIWKGDVALKTQTIKVFEKVKSVHAGALTPFVLELFGIVWEDLSRLGPSYSQLFVDSGDSESKLIDSDSIPYSLDFLVLEEIDFLSSALNAKSVRNELQNQMQQAGGAEHTTPWLQELIRLLILYSRIPREEESFWEFDANTYLCEVTSTTATYSPRVASSALLVHSLLKWLKQSPVKVLLSFHEQYLAGGNVDWKDTESFLLLARVALQDVSESSAELDNQLVNSMLQQTSPYLHHENIFVRAGFHLALGSLFTVASQEFNEAAISALQAAIQAVHQDESLIVQVCCIMTTSDYLKALPSRVVVGLQAPIVEAVKFFVDTHDLRDELEDADDVKGALIVTLRDAILLNVNDLTVTPAMDLFFSLASDGAGNFQLSDLLIESFQSIVSAVAQIGNDAYTQLCAKVIPSLAGAFDVAMLTSVSDLTTLAAELVCALAEYGSEPLPDGFVPAVMPKIQRVLMEGTEATLLKPSTSALSHMLNKGTNQVKSWTDHQGKPSIQVCLEVVDRLLNPNQIEEAAADEVGYLATSMVNKFGFDALGDYLPQLLRAVAIRLSTAERAAFIQSLLMVFASLSVQSPHAVLDFLDQTQVDTHNGLVVTLTKWLENSINFAGFDEIRTNVVALSKIFDVNDPRVENVQVKGDIIIDEQDSSRIKTRSRARLNPDRYALVSAHVKILKLLVDECFHAVRAGYSDLATSKLVADATAADGDNLDGDVDGNDDNDDDGEWEDDNDDPLDLGSEKVRNELMMLVGEDGRDGGVSPTGSRARDDETAAYLLDWFRMRVNDPLFQSRAALLNREEQDRLRGFVV